MGDEITPTLIQEHHWPSTIRYGTSEKRLTKVYIEITVTASDDTLDLVTYLPGLTGIIGIDSSSLDGADVSAGTENTFSGTILTFAGDTGSHVWKISLLAYY